MQHITKPNAPGAVDSRELSVDVSIRPARDRAWQLLTVADWQTRHPKMVEKYLALRYATDPRRLYGLLFFNDDGTVFDQEILSVSGEWSVKNLVKSAAIHDAAKIVIFAVRNGDPDEMDNLAGTDKHRIQAAQSQLQLIDVHLISWIQISGTTAMTVPCEKKLSSVGW